MKRGIKKQKTMFAEPVNEAYAGESIEAKMERVIASHEGIDNVAPMIYTERKDGVVPQYDVRTDRFDIAMEAMDAAARSNAAKRDQKIEAQLASEAEAAAAANVTYVTE